MPSDGFLRYEALGIAQLLKSRSLEVPFYQRSYSWFTLESRKTSAEPASDNLQVVEFWDDLVRSFTARSSYFLGTVVLAREGGSAVGRQAVIDGQQRLATTSLLLTAIRDRYRLQGEEDFANSTQTDFLAKFDRSVGMHQSILIMNTDDRDFFDRRIIGSDAAVLPTKLSQELLLDAYEYFVERVKDFVDAQGTSWRDKLSEFVDWLVSEVQIVAIDVASEADAFLIFETLNDRGADLTIADLLKNFLFSQAGARLDEVRDNWVATLANLGIGKIGNQRFTSFARHLLSSKYGLVREREVYSRLKGIVSGPASAVTFTQELKDAARLYYAILTADADYWNDHPAAVSDAADVLAELNLERYRPLVLAALGTFPKAEIARFIPAMVSWSIRMLCAGTLGGGVAEAAFCDAAKEIRAGSITTTEEVLSRSKVGGLVPADGGFQTQFATWRVSSSSLSRYLLRALEIQQRGEAEPELVVNDDVDQVNLEHIFPKNATDADWPAFPGEDKRVWFERLGNHALLQKGPNGRIGNKPWVIKQPVLASSQLELTAETALEPDWTPATVSARQDALSVMAVQVWPREPRTH